MNVLVLVLDTLCVLVFGAAVARWAQPRGVAMWLAACFTGGCSAVVVIGETVGRVSYSPVSMTTGAVLFGLVGAGGLWALRREPAGFTWQRVRRSASVCLSPWLTKIAAAVWVALVLYSIAASITLPPTVPDVLRYHLPMVVGWIQEGRVGVVPELDFRANFFAHSIQLLNGWCFLLAGSRWAVMPQVALSGVLWPLVSYLVMRAAGVRRRWSVFGALLASMNTPVVLQMRNELVDAGFYAFLILAFGSGIRQRAWAGRPWLLSGLAAGMALSAKNSGLLAAAVWAAVFLLGDLRTLRPSLLRSRLPAAMPRLALASTVALGVGSWFYGANWVAFGSPVYPFQFDLGLVEFAGPDPSYPIHYLHWVREAGGGPSGFVDQVLGGMHRWIPLFLALPPFGRFISPGSGGYGPVVPAMLVGLVFALGIGAATGHVRSQQFDLKPFGLALVATLLVWNLLLLGHVSLILPGAAAVDARYQAHWPLVFALLCVAVLQSLRAHRARRAVAVCLLAVFVLGGSAFVKNAPNRGWGQFDAVVLQGKPASFVYTGRPFFVSRDPEELDRILGEAPVLMMGRGHTYILQWPSHKRRVYQVGLLGPSRLVVHKAEIDERVLAAGVRNIAEMVRLRERRLSGLDTGVRLSRRPDVQQASLAYIEAVATRYQTPYLYVQGRPVDWLGARPNWTLVTVQKGPGDRDWMTLYRFQAVDLPKVSS